MAHIINGQKNMHSYDINNVARWENVFKADQSTEN